MASVGWAKVKRLTGLFVLQILLLLSVNVIWAQSKPDALELYRQGKYKEAAAVCREELKEMPNRMDSYTVLGWSLIGLKDYKEALKVADEGLKISRYDNRVIEIKAEALFYLGRTKEALKYFEEYAALAPTGSRIEKVYYFMGECYILLRQYNNADTAFSTALYLMPNIATWWARLGYTREMEKEYKWALEAYNRALSLNPSLDEAVRGKARVERKLQGG